ncbi:MAG: biotin-dependent carboxyltransferase family protein [Mycobacteriaceae bacterium]|nr:biotin-dependent carboxyltransferase family protein [Mycobacteriaceae bacterium]
MEHAGRGATVQDLGRPGWWSAGVGVSGAADRASLRLANRLVGNPEAAAGLEILLGGVAVRTLRRTTLAVTGAPAPVTVDATPVGHNSVLELGPGVTVRIGVASAGLRVYLGVRGGVAAPRTLGSAGRDTLSDLGCPPIQAGDVLAAGPIPTALPLVQVAPVPAITDGPRVIEAVRGPRDDWFADAGLLFTGAWQVSSEADRVGVRLDRAAGPPLRRLPRGELPPEGMALGAVQIPPDGRPVVFLADHPITGGYPVIGVVLDADVDRVAQARPGSLIRFLEQSV